MLQVIAIKTFYTSKRTFFLPFYFFKKYLQIAQEEFKQPIKQLHYQFRSRNEATRVLDKILSCL